MRRVKSCAAVILSVATLATVVGLPATEAHAARCADCGGGGRQFRLVEPLYCDRRLAVVAVP
jgi:hypothetical protein